jgi:hypothetical protein
MTRIFLILNTLIWLPYGVSCFLDPGALVEMAGVGASTPTGTTELRAMYGGLQASVGVWASYAVWKPEAARGALTALVALPAGLAIGRLGGAVMDDAFSSYTVAVLIFEILLASAAAFLLRRADA